MTIGKISSLLWVGACILALLSGCGDTAEGQPPESLVTGSSSALQQEQAIVSGPDAAFKESVSVWAGSLEPGLSNGSNTQAQFIKPYGLCAAPGGGLLIVDCYANQLRRSNQDIVSSLAGNVDTIDQGGYPFAGYLNGESGQALLNQPRFAAVSAEGAVIFSDTGNHRVRVLYQGAVRLLAGDGTSGYQDGNYKTARFNTPSGVAIDADGTVFIADTLNHCIRMVSREGDVTTLAGSPQKEGYRDGILSEALFCEPNDLQLGLDGALYVVDKGNQRIRRITADGVTTIAGSGEEKDSLTGYIVGGYQDGAALQAQFQYPTGLYITDDGQIYVADTGNNCIRRIAVNGRVTTVAGTKMPGNVNGSLKEARFNQPIDVYFDNTALYVSDSYNHVVKAIYLEGTQS